MTIKVWSWEAREGLTNILPFYWVMAEEDPIEQAEKTAHALLAKKEGERAIFFWHDLPAPDNTLQGLKKQILNGLHFDRRHFYEDFFLHYHEINGPKIDRIVLDYESGNSVWVAFGGLSEDQVKALTSGLYSDPLIYAQMSLRMKALKPEEFVWNPKWHEAMEAWNFWLGPKVLLALRETIVTPAYNFLGYKPAISNYGGMNLTFNIYDQNNWLVPKNNALTSESCPVAYLSGEGQRYNGMTVARSKEGRWNAFIDQINSMRSSAWTGPVVPWIAFPLYQGDASGPAKNTFLWEALITHAIEMGVKEFLYFNPGQANEPTEKFVSNLMAKFSPKRTLKLPEIPLDSDSVVTATIKTTYADYLKHV